MSVIKLIERLSQRDFLHVLRKACRERHVTLEEVLSKSRMTAVVRAREDCVMVLLKEGISTKHIAELLNYGDHSAVIGARDRVLARAP